jgi:SAM-dependent methyltransferase
VTAFAAVPSVTGASYEAGGRVFPLDDAYFADLMRARPLEQVARLPIFAGAALDAHRAKINDVSFDQFLVKLYETALVLDALRITSRRQRFGRALDIGSGPALQARILRLLGRTAQAEAIDIYDGSPRCSEGRLQRYVRTLQILYTGYRTRKLIPGSLRRRIRRLRAIEEKVPLGVEGFGYRPDEAPYRARFRSGRSLDRYHVGDLFVHEGRYDLVTSFMALEYFDFDRLAAKVASLLGPGGLFCFLVSYWWYPVNNTLLYGRFPYLLQQLGSQETLEYYRRVHPDLPLDGITERIGYSDQSRPTVADYERLGHAHGLTPLTAFRLHPDHVANARSTHGPLAIDRRRDWPLSRVLENARRVKPDLGVADLMTSHVLMLFERR